MGQVLVDEDELRRLRTRAAVMDSGDCQHRAPCAQVLLPIPLFLFDAGAVWKFDPTHPEYGINEWGDRCLRVDACIVDALSALWRAEVVTRSSCCGHGSGWGLVTIQPSCGPQEAPGAQETLEEGVRQRALEERVSQTLLVDKDQKTPATDGSQRYVWALPMLADGYELLRHVTGGKLPWEAEALMGKPGPPYARGYIMMAESFTEYRDRGWIEKLPPYTRRGWQVWGISEIGRADLAGRVELAS